ncbi:hypothetical protein [Puniceicoccus vermicola]|uniref:Uncharacterized protein n=1 Tax=Puniceicoccus vermicola TaxID=388746 RepID=A0A7X1AWV6_9BACT|nr:hypothetical protein [Puniceicoccus vermicola]MBC2601407.1 hypothetical protein [Puniceicoccus vermicola]
MTQAPPPSPERNLIPEPDRLDSGLKDFLRLSGGNILYCLSALSVLYGIAEILGPQLLKSTDSTSGFLCVGALNAYELSVLGILIFIVVVHRVMDDAVTLVLLIPPFLVGSAVALVTIAYNNPELALSIGAVCAAVGIGKIEALRRWIGLRVNWIAFIGLGLVVVWNFLTGVLLVKASVSDNAPDLDTRGWWLACLLFLLLSGLLVLSQMILAADKETDPRTPFLRRASMFQCFSLLLFSALGIHLYALSYIFHVPTSPGDFLLFATLCTLMLVEVIFQSTEDNGDAAAIIAAFPLSLAVVGVFSGVFSAPRALNLEILGHPLSSAILGSVGMVWFALRTRSQVSGWVAGAYLLGVIFFMGYSPGNLSSLNWISSGTTLVIALFVGGLVFKKSSLCLVAVGLAAVGSTEFPAYRDFWAQLDVGAGTGILWILGLGFVSIALWFREDDLLPLGVISVVILVFAAFTTFEPVLQPRDWVSIALLIGVGLVLYMRFHHLALPVILLIPILERLWKAVDSLGNWWFVILGFGLLVSGGWFSSIKGRQAKAEELQDEG